MLGQLNRGFESHPLRQLSPCASARELGVERIATNTRLINIIVTTAFKLTGEIPLPGKHSEAMAINRAGDKMYVNLTGPKETGFQAKTSLMVPQLNRLYIAVSRKGKADATLALHVYDVQP